MDGDVSELNSDVKYEKWGFDNNYVLRLSVSSDTNYSDARKKAKETIENLPESHRLVLSADCFDYVTENDYPETKDGIIYLPSKKFANPLLSFDTGVSFGKELCNATF